jgi:cytochrome b561
MENRTYTTIYRIMHWAIAICMLLLLLTIFLRLTWMNKNNVSDIIQDFLATTNVSLSEDETILLAKKIRKPMWDWHIYLGYTLVGLYSIRMLLPFFGYMKFSNPFTKELSGKTKFQYSLYLVFYLCVAISLITGLIIELGPKNLKTPMEEIHVLSIYYLVAFIVLHIGGVLYAEFTISKGIISKIVSGNK